jgi:hypothetical protein
LSLDRAFPVDGGLDPTLEGGKVETRVEAMALLFGEHVASAF